MLSEEAPKYTSAACPQTLRPHTPAPQQRIAMSMTSNPRAGKKTSEEVLPKIPPKPYEKQKLFLCQK